jgi:hypothetical protein
MLRAETQIDTERPGRYLVQLCRHAATMGSTRGHRFRAHASGDPQAHRNVQVHAEWSETHGSIQFEPWGRCTIEASATTLLLRVEATDEDNLRRIQDVITRDLGTFGRRDHLTVNWQQPGAPAATPRQPRQAGPPAELAAASWHRWYAADGCQPDPAGWSGAEGLLRHRRLVDLRDR